MKVQGEASHGAGVVQLQAKDVRDCRKHQKLWEARKDPPHPRAVKSRALLTLQL